jgi:hypothetical protein
MESVLRKFKPTPRHNACGLRFDRVIHTSGFDGVHYVGELSNIGPSLRKRRTINEHTVVIYHGGKTPKRKSGKAFVASCPNYSRDSNRVKGAALFYLIFSRCKENDPLFLTGGFATPRVIY